jgi:hypothetical protein
LTSVASIARQPVRGLRIVALVSVLTLVALLTFVPLGSNDFWLQAKVGELIVEQRRVPHTVLFPFTWAAENHFNAHEWLPSVLFHLLDEALGYHNLLFIQGALGLLTFALCLACVVRLGGRFAVALPLSLAAMLVANYRWHLRPEMFALLLFVGLLFSLSAYRLRGGAWRLAWCAPIGLLWANAHGSFLLGPVVAGIFAAGEGIDAALRAERTSLAGRTRAGVIAARPYLAAGAVLVLASLVNPLGIQLLLFALELSSSEVTRTFIKEWVPTFSSEFLRTRAFRLIGGTFLLAVVVLAACRRRVGTTDVLLLVAFGVLAASRSRYGVLVGFVVLVVCANALRGADWCARRERLLLGGSALVALVGLGLGLRFGNAYGAYPYHTPSDDFSIVMVARIGDPRLQGNVLNSYELGAELIYRAYPRLRPSIDSRIDSYGDAYYLMHGQLLVDERLLADFLEEFDVRHMLLLRRDYEDVRRLRLLRTQGWRTIAADHKMVLLTRDPALAGPLSPAATGRLPLRPERAASDPARRSRSSPNPALPA